MNALTGAAKYEKEAKRTFEFFAGTLKIYGTGLITMAEALDVYVEGLPLEGKKNEK